MIVLNVQDKLDNGKDAYCYDLGLSVITKLIIREFNVVVG
jgi:hypothetical protein